MKINKDKNKTLIYKSKGKSILIEPIFNSNKICFDFDTKDSDINFNKQMKNSNKNRNKNRMKTLNFNSRKFRTNTTSVKNDRNNVELNNNKLEFSTEKVNNENFLNEFELLYNCIKKKRESYNKKQRSKSGRKERNPLMNKKSNKNSLTLDKNIFGQDSILGILYENKQIKKKNNELYKQFNIIKKEFEQIKKDNKDIKEELKEKSKFIKDIKLSMDIFSQELLKLQNIYKEDKIGHFSNNSNNLSRNYTRYYTNANNSKKLLIDKDNINKPKLNIEINNNHKIIINNEDNNNNNMKIKTNNYISTEKKDNIHYETSTNTINNDNIQKINRFEKIHQLPLNNINNIIKKQNRERGNSNEGINFQDTSKLINIETKDATEKDNNEYTNEKLSYNINKENNQEKEKAMEINDKNKSMEEKDSIELSNISLVDNLNINEENYNIALNKNKRKMGKLLELKSEKIGNKNKEEERIKKVPKKLNFMNDNFNEEFMKYYDKFSDSWRKEVDKMLKKGSI